MFFPLLLLFIILLRKIEWEQNTALIKYLRYTFPQTDRPVSIVRVKQPPAVSVIGRGKFNCIAGFQAGQVRVFSSVVPCDRRSSAELFLLMPIRQFPPRPVLECQLLEYIWKIAGAETQNAWYWSLDEIVY